jgi:hypothetical protein
MPCCQQWRKRALTYLLDEKTLYKLAGTNIIFSSDRGKWKSCFKKVMNKEDMVKVEQILVSFFKFPDRCVFLLTSKTDVVLSFAYFQELCCLELSSHKWDEVIKKLMEPCEHISCSTDSLDLWCRSNKIQAIELEVCFKVCLVSTLFFQGLIAYRFTNSKSQGLNPYVHYPCL